MEKILSDVLGDARAWIVGAILFLVAEGFKGIYRRFKLSLQRSIWKALVAQKNGVFVVLTTKENGDRSSTPKVSLNEVTAYALLKILFDKLGISSELCGRANLGLADISEKNIVSLGGPKSNRVSKDILEAVYKKYPGFPVVYDENNVLLKTAKDTYIPTFSQDGSLATDYGVILRTSSLLPGNKGETIFLAFGCRGRGTLGAVKALTDNIVPMEKIENQVKDGDFITLMKFSFSGDQIVSTDIVLTQKLIQ